MLRWWFGSRREVGAEEALVVQTPPLFSAPRDNISTCTNRETRNATRSTRTWRSRTLLPPVIRTLIILILVFILCARNYKQSLTVVEKLDGHLEELAFWLPHARREDATSFVATVDNKDSATASAEIANRDGKLEPIASNSYLIRSSVEHK